MSVGPSLSEIKERERVWQNQEGWTLQERAYARAGTRLVLDRQFARIARELKLAPGQRMLDLGCGIGHLLTWLHASEPGARCHGIDLSLNTVRRAFTDNPALRLAVADAETLPFLDGSFDRISCNGSGHHFLRFDAAMAEVWRVLKPGGRLVMFEPIATPIAEAIRKGLLTDSKYESPVDLAHKHEFTRSSVERTLAETGFTNISSRFSDFLAYPLSGMYMGLPWSGSRALLGGLSAIESGLDRLTPLKPIWDLVSWRLLIVADRP